ncbi:gonadal somatic cell derived factor [Lampris incognitus]|uniref:gonadal somatic cell derived factor n=1 Tax=Lampris incognitus TaxID=2546036 RepID=UPI0024B59F0B|nr:gonadal somatic cell derived factor [Lampris incognitus]
MSAPSFIMIALLSSSVAMAFVLHPSEEEPVTPASPAVARKDRCQGKLLPSIRKELLGALTLQNEPRMPAGGLATIREQWMATSSSITRRAKRSAVPPTVGPSVASGVGNNTDPQCCHFTCQIFLKDLGWDNWVIYPESFTFVQCTAFNPLLDMKTFLCPLQSPSVNETLLQKPCCQPTVQDMVPILYMDELSNVVISDMQLTRACGCSPTDPQQLKEE